MAATNNPELPTIDDMQLLWDAFDRAEDEPALDVDELRAAHARVLNYLYRTGLFRRAEET